MDENGNVEIDRRLPEGIEIEFPEIDALDIGGDNGADSSEVLHRIGQFGCGFLRVWKGNRSKH